MGKLVCLRPTSGSGPSLTESPLLLENPVPHRVWSSRLLRLLWSPKTSISLHSPWHNLSRWHNNRSGLPTKIFILEGVGFHWVIHSHVCGAESHNNGFTQLSWWSYVGNIVLVDEMSTMFREGLTCIDGSHFSRVTMFCWTRLFHIDSIHIGSLEDGVGHGVACGPVMHKIVCIFLFWLESDR